MKPDLYTKAVLTVIAIALVLIAANQYIHPRVTARADSNSDVRFAVDPSGRPVFFDPRTDEVWFYDETGLGDEFVSRHVKLDKVGQGGKAEAYFKPH